MNCNVDAAAFSNETKESKVTIPSRSEHQCPEMVELLKHMEHRSFGAKTVNSIVKLAPGAWKPFPPLFLAKTTLQTSP